MASLTKPVSFGSHFNFTDPLFSYTFDVGSLEADVKLLRLSDGSIYNADGTGQAAVKLPYQRRVRCILKSDTPGTVATNYATIIGVVGEPDTLTVEDTNDSQWTCSAILESVRGDLPAEPMDQVLRFEFDMNFIQTTDWTAVP